MHMLVEQDKKTSAKTKQAQHQSKHASKPLTASALSNCLYINMPVDRPWCPSGLSRNVSNSS